MLKTKIKSMTPQERKAKVLELRQEHEDYFQTIGIINALYIPKMAYRPTGKDELHVSFFPSELQKSTLYLLKHNAHWLEEYEIVTSSSGFERHIIPVSELKVINDVTDRSNPIQKIVETVDIKNPDERQVVDVLIGIERALLSINQKLSK